MSISISGNGTFTGVSTNYSFDKNVSVGGTLTYEDVTNVDSIGVITARNGIEVTGGNVHIAGVGATIGVATAYIGSIEVTGGNVHIAGVGATLGVTTAYISSINDLGYPSAGPLSNRNMVINGAMQVAQRGNTVSSINSGTGYYTTDRFRLDVSMGTWTSDRMTNSQGDTYESGSTERFRNSLRLTCTAGQASPGATDHVKIVYFIEGQDVQHLDYGTSNAKTMTLSFWVRSTKTGTGTLELIQEDNSDRQYSASYTINATNTWEQKVITIPGDTSGLINNDSGRGLDLIWWLNSGSTYTGGSQGGWRALVNNNRNSDNLAIGSANDDEFFLTGVQLEVGTRATPFEHRSYSDMLDKCQRYFQQIGPLGRLFGAASSPTTLVFPLSLASSMRGTPVFRNNAISQIKKYDATNVSFGSATFSVGNFSELKPTLDYTISNVSVNDNTVYWLTFTSLQLDAEL
jgi:hypothetical protein